MTAVMTRAEPAVQWGTMPGWTVVADLTPPELLNARRLAVLRKRLLAGLVVLVLLCAAGWSLAYYKHQQSALDAEAASGVTVTLQQQMNRYSGITRMQNLTQTADGQIAQLLSQDVDVAKLVTRIRAALPASMSILNLTVNVTAAGSANTAATGTPATPLNTSGLPEIGTITVTGSARTINDLPTFVDNLGLITGLVSVVPQSDQAGTGKNGSTQFSVTASMTNQLLSHAFAHGPLGGR